MTTIIRIETSDCQRIVDTLSKQQKENAQVIDAGCCECPRCRKKGCFLSYEVIQLMPF